MAWIELHQSIWNNKKTLILAAELDLPEVYAAAHMIHLWTWALDAAPEGDLSGLNNRVIAKGAGWSGDPDAFVTAAIIAKWLDQKEDELYIHDWYDYAGRLIEKRREDAERKRTQRGVAKNVHGMSSGRPLDTPWDGAGKPNLTIPNQEIYSCASLDALASKNGRAAGQDPDGSVEAEKVTATSGEQRARTPFKSKQQERMFDNFWALYPKKRAKGNAERAWSKINPSDELFEQIKESLQRAITSLEWTREGGQYIPYPASWLNAKGWEDEYNQTRSVSKTYSCYGEDNEIYIPPGMG